MLGIGQDLGNYRIVGKLGHGGMGVVYEAEHPLIGKRVALKVIHKELSQNTEVITRFFNEARAVNQIGNDHVVDISDFGQTPDGEHFLVMEVLVGESLADRLEREGKLPVPSALHVGAQIADGLAAAHAAGVVHRDLKPDNVFLIDKLGDREFVKILDFGLAKLMIDGGVSVTKQGVILGTPEYMSPEQAESKRTIDHRSDVYALGIVLYQMTTGLLPFVGGSMGEVLVKHVSRSPAPPRGVNPDIPPAVEQIILRCLAKRPEERFQGMADLRAALLDPDRWLGRPSTPLPVAEAAALPRAATPLPVPPPRAPTPVPLPRATTPVPSDPVLTASPSARTLLGTGVTTPPAAAELPDLRPPAPVLSSTVLLPPDVAAGRAGRGRGLRVAALGVVIGFALAGGVWFVRRATSTTPPPPPRVAVAVPAPLALPDAPPPSAPPPAPTHVRIVINTNPSGAEIFDEATGERLGVSPVELSLPRGTGERALVIRHPGCGEKHRSIRTTSDAELTLDLDPAAPPPPPAPAPAAPPEKPPTPTSDLLAPQF